ncbi:MAG: hypothetical protein QOH00_1490 [Gaiellales bacterium]|nr:hypothetical protein [Gaiellales bacterium]
MQAVRCRCERYSSECGIDAQDHAVVQAQPNCLARADLEHVACPPATGHAPGREVVDDTHDLQVCVAEDDVERHSHEEHVDRLLPESEALARGQGTAAEQAARPAHGAASEAHALEQAPAVGRAHVVPGIHPTPTVVVAFRQRGSVRPMI